MRQIIGKQQARASRSAAGRERERRLCAMNEALSLLFSVEAHRKGRLVSALWHNWEAVLGEDLACIALPMGHKDDQLIVGAEDNMSLQEISMQTPEILERVNAFMGEEAFARVKAVLLLGKRPLNPRREQRPIAPLAPAAPPRPPGLGGLLNSMDPASVVADCYKAYIAMYAGRKS